MSLSQFGYTSVYPPPSSSPLASSQLLPPVSSSSTPSSSSTSSPSMSVPCCEKGTPLNHPHTGHTICSCQYPTTGILSYPRLPLPDSAPPNTHSGFSYGHAPPQSYVPLPPDHHPSALYHQPFPDGVDSWRGLGPAPACYPYDPTTIPSYPYPNSYGGVDINSAARRKNATRENTNTLKAWLYEHRKNPYPTKGEKIMLAIITKMTLTQVSTWFANARRRLKKENKMTWSPRNKPGDNDDDDDDEDKEKNDNDDIDEDKNAEANKAVSEDSRNDERDSNPPGDVSAPDCSGVRGHPITTQLFDPPHPEPSGLGPHFGFDGQGHPSLGSAIPGRPLNFPPQHPHHQQPNPNLYQLTSDNMQGSPLLQGQKNPSLVYSSSSSNQNIHSLEGIPEMTLKMERGDSLCMGGNEAGLGEVPNNNCRGYPGDGSMMEGMRPKIWSLAHVASSENGYINHADSITTSTNNSLLNNNKLNCYNNNTNNNIITANNNNYHNSNGGSNGTEGMHHNYDQVHGARGEQLMSSGRQHNNMLPMVTPGMERYPGQVDTDTSLIYHPNSNTHSSSPLSSPSPSSSTLLSSSSSNSLPSLLPPATSQQWPPSMYGNSYYSPYNNRPSPGPAPQYSPAPPPPPPSSVHPHAPPPLHSNLPPPPHPHHSSSTFRRVTGQTNINPYPQNSLVGGGGEGIGGDGGVENGGMPLSPTSISSPAMPSSTSLPSSSSSHAYSDMHSSPNMYDNSKAGLSNE